MCTCQVYIPDGIEFTYALSMPRRPGESFSTPRPVPIPLYHFKSWRLVAISYAAEVRLQISPLYYE